MHQRWWTVHVRIPSQGNRDALPSLWSRDGPVSCPRLRLEDHDPGEMVIRGISPIHPTPGHGVDGWHVDNDVD